MAWNQYACKHGSKNLTMVCLASDSEIEAKSPTYADSLRCRLCQRAADTRKPEDAERAVRLTCLRPMDDASVREATLALAREAVELGQETKGHLPRCHLTLGMAEYRSGHYLAAAKEGEP